MDLDAHLPVMCDLWETVLFRTGTYRRNALHPHQRRHGKANLTPPLFARWLALWRATVDDRYAGPKAEFAKLQGTRIAGAMCGRITGDNVSPPGTGAVVKMARNHPSPAGCRKS